MFWGLRVRHNSGGNIVLILDGNSAIGARVRRKLCNLICLKNLLICLAEKTFFLHARTTCSELQSNINTMGGNKFKLKYKYFVLNARRILGGPEVLSSFLSGEDPEIFSTDPAQL